MRGVRALGLIATGAAVVALALLVIPESRQTDGQRPAHAPTVVTSVPATEPREPLCDPEVYGTPRQPDGAVVSGLLWLFRR